GHTESRTRAALRLALHAALPISAAPPVLPWRRPRSARRAAAGAAGGSHRPPVAARERQPPAWLQRTPWPPRARECGFRPAAVGTAPARPAARRRGRRGRQGLPPPPRSEEHTSELQ